MPSESFVSTVFVALGIWGVIAVLIVAVSWKFLQQWLTGRIAAGVERELHERLAIHQLRLDKQLEDHRSRLEIERDHLRSSLDKSIADYRIYAEKRASAIAELFASYLKAELKAIDRTMFSLPDSLEVSSQALEQLLEWLRVKAPQAVEIREACKQRSGHANSLIREAADALKGTLALEARDDAHEAYFKAVLFLPVSVERPALAVRDYFHEIAGDHVIPGERGLQYVEHKTRLRFLMLQLQNAARDELGASAVSDARAWTSIEAE